MTAIHPEMTGCGGFGLLEGLSTPLWLLRFDGNVVWLNRPARALLDLPDGLPLRTARADVPAAVLDALAGAGADARVDARIAFRCGDRRGEVAVDARLSVARDPATAAHGRLVLVEAPGDAPARQEVIRLTEQLVALSYAYPDMRFDLRHDGTILDFAAASPSELNIPAERFLARRVQDVLPDPAGGLIGAALERLRSGDTVTGVEFELPGPQGERVFEARMVTLPDGGRILCSIRNVTERVTAERRARHAHALLIHAIESIDQGFVLYDADDRLVLCNGRYRELYSTWADLIRPGARFTDILRAGAERGLYAVPPEALEAWLADRLDRHRDPGPPFEQLMSDGRWILVEERRTVDGGTVGLRTDITDLKRRAADLQAARDEAERANRRKSDYVHHLSHELRTPLNAVMGFAQIIADEMMGPVGTPCYRDYAGQIATAGVYMLDLINGILDLAKIEAGRMTVADEPCNLALIIDLTFGMMQPRAERAGVVLVSDVPPELPAVLGDVPQIRQMLTNLIANAIKFSRGEDRRVMVRAVRCDDGGIVVSVEDNGIGMAPQDIPRALDAFGQVHDRPLPGDRGTGLGLPLTRALIELHGGSLAITSTPGVGTTVSLAFPASRVAAE
ncbi:PAS domain-containing sensor histidine kinase [Azospirillum halopraeferens]|uniref:PAS domain-containing sensor histidine kinase n=1 Tax=Azospirillum halopraeferens TaxID=34010 RepID=UPI0012EBDAEA|nr:PAS-domain containing protein [Azospirillum halopraeferens]